VGSCIRKTTNNIPIEFDNNRLVFIFETPVPDELRQQIAELVAKATKTRFTDSYESYSHCLDSEEQPYLHGYEAFTFED
jgi:hypothetical protein